MATVSTIVSIPGYGKFKNEISKPLLVEILVPFPPRQAPKLKAQASVSMGSVSRYSKLLVFLLVLDVISQSVSN